MLHDLAMVGGAGVVIGCFAGAGADVFPTYRKILQEFGGALLVGGVAVFGLVFPLI